MAVAARTVRVAIAQFAPEVLNLERSVKKAVSIISDASRQKASLVAFPETWIPVYPLWVDMGTFSQWDHPGAKKLFARLHAQSLEIGSDEFRSIAAAAREHAMYVVLGVNERSGRSIYNSLLFLDPTGTLIGHHRKLVPTFGERLVWGHGDAAGLRTHDTPFGKLGGLICWEHWMPAARQVLHDQGEIIHVAAWPHGKERHQIASRHYAFEGRAFVLAAAQYLEKAMFPAAYELAGELDSMPDVLIDGGSAVIAPNGDYLVEPVHGREELIVADLDLTTAIEESLTLDVAGHYSRPDIFTLDVVRRRKDPSTSA